MSTTLDALDAPDYLQPYFNTDYRNYLSSYITEHYVSKFDKVKTADIMKVGVNASDAIYLNYNIYNLTNLPVYVSSNVTGSIRCLSPKKRLGVLGMRDGILICVEDLNTGYGAPGTNYDGYYPPQLLEKGANAPTVHVRMFYISREEITKEDCVNILELGLCFSLRKEVNHCISNIDILKGFKQESEAFKHQFTENGTIGLRLLSPGITNLPTRIYSIVNNTIVTVPIIIDSNIIEPSINVVYKNIDGRNVKETTNIPLNKLSSGTTVHINGLEIFLTSERHIVENALMDRVSESDQLKIEKQRLIGTIATKDAEIKALTVKLAEDKSVTREAVEEVVNKKNKSRNDLITNILKIGGAILAFITVTYKFVESFLKKG